MMGKKKLCILMLAVVIGIAHSEPSKTEKDQYIDIFPPKHYPGDTISKTDTSSINEALVEIEKSIGLLQSSNVALAIAAESGDLSNPQIMLVDGEEHAVMPYDVETGQTVLNLYSNGLMNGVYGVVTFDIEGTSMMVAVMFSVPFNWVLYGLEFNMKIYQNTVAVDKDLVKQMYENAGPWFPGSYFDREEYGIKMRGSMTDNDDSRVIIWVDHSNYNLGSGPSKHAECAKKGLTSWKCWRECTPVGWCWTHESCSHSNECNGDTLLCDGACNDV